MLVVPHSITVKDTTTHPGSILKNSTSKTKAKTFRVNLLVRNENHYHPVKPHQQYSPNRDVCGKKISNSSLFPSKKVPKTLRRSDKTQSPSDFFPIVEVGDTARSVAREKWREIPPEPPGRMTPATIDRVLGIGYLCGCESDCQSWGEYLKVWEAAV